MALKISNKNRKSTNNNSIPEPLIDTQLLKNIEINTTEFTYKKLYIIIAVIISIILIL